MTFIARSAVYRNAELEKTEGIKVHWFSACDTRDCSVCLHPLHHLLDTGLPWLLLTCDLQSSIAPQVGQLKNSVEYCTIVIRVTTCTGCSEAIIKFIELVIPVYKSPNELFVGAFCFTS